MATIDISVSKFSNTSLNGSRTIQLSRQKCIKFAIGVGTSHYSASFRKTKTAVALASYRAMAVRCVFDFGSKGKPLEPYRDYRRLEATEKVNLSYWIGMTMAGVAVDEVLGVTKTTHASHMGRKITHSNPKTKSLADLVGFENKRYHIIEAKGRQTKPSTILRNAWKTQAQTISKVNGVAVSTNSYSVGLIDSPVVIELEDPPANDPNGMDLKMSPESFGVGYYEPYIDFLRIGETFQVNVRNVPFLVRPIALDPIDGDWIFVGLEAVIASGRVSKNERLMDWFCECHGDGENWYVGKDGVLIATACNPCNSPKIA